MPSAKRVPTARKRSKSKTAAKPALLRRTKGQLKTTAKGRPRRTLNGIPLKRKVVWVYDIESPKFKAMLKRELQDIRRQDAERDGIEFVEAALADPEVQKWWT